MDKPYKGKTATIGVFDSGVGGLTVLAELVRMLPNFSYLYFADAAFCPYGSKSNEQILQRARIATDFLLAKGCQLVVVACNTATAAAISSLRNSYSIPFVGMEPAIKPAAQTTKTKIIGVLATAGTFNGKLYQETVQRYAQGVEIIYRVGDGLVELVEKAKHKSPAARELLMKYIEPMISANADHIVLGCTHYPFFIHILNEIVPPNISIVDPAPAVALQTQRIVDGMSLPPSTSSSAPSIQLFSSAPHNHLETLSEVIAGTHRKSFYKFLPLA